MSSITLYFCGTGHDRNTKIGANALQDSFHATLSDCWIFDGPGSKTSIPQWKYKTMPNGKTILDTADKKWQSKPGKLAKTEGTLFGTGLHYNSYLAHQLVNAALERRHNFYQYINLVGHSRGAITAMRAAHTITRDRVVRLSGAQVHLYLNDPVFGASLSDDPYDNEVPAGANSAWIIQMEDLSRRDNLFMKGAPRLKEDQAKNRIVIPMPGGHGNALEHQKDGVPQGVIGTALLHKFLENRNVVLKHFFRLTDLEICELYAQVKLGLLKRSFFGNLTVKSRASSRAAWVENEFRKHTVFVNWHHASCFKSICPTIYDFIRCQDLGLRVMLPSTKSAERAHIIKNMPFTTQLFVENKLFSGDTDTSMARDSFPTSHSMQRWRVRSMFR